VIRRSPLTNRANESLKLMPLAVDWIYNAHCTNGQPVLSRRTSWAIRNGFAAWAEACRHASTAYATRRLLMFTMIRQSCVRTILPTAWQRIIITSAHGRMMTLMSTGD